MLQVAPTASLYSKALRFLSLQVSDQPYGYDLQLAGSGFYIPPLCVPVAFYQSMQAPSEPLAIQQVGVCQLYHSDIMCGHIKKPKPVSRFRFFFISTIADNGNCLGSYHFSGLVPITVREQKRCWWCRSVPEHRRPSQPRHLSDPCRFPALLLYRCDRNRR